MIYVASSCRNKNYPEVIKRLRQEGFSVYDLYNPPHGGIGFHWTDVDENVPNWTFEEYAEGLPPFAEANLRPIWMPLIRPAPVSSSFLAVEAPTPRPAGRQVRENV